MRVWLRWRWTSTELVEVGYASQNPANLLCLVSGGSTDVSTGNFHLNRPAAHERWKMLVPNTSDQDEQCNLNGFKQRVWILLRWHFGIQTGRWSSHPDANPVIGEHHVELLHLDTGRLSIHALERQKDGPISAVSEFFQTLKHSVDWKISGVAWFISRGSFCSDDIVRSVFSGGQYHCFPPVICFQFPWESQHQCEWAECGWNEAKIMKVQSNTPGLR